jgi:hypothetical protein
MPIRQGTAYRVSERRVAGTFGVARTSMVTHTADATHAQ